MNGRRSFLFAPIKVLERRKLFAVQSFGLVRMVALGTAQHGVIVDLVGDLGHVRNADLSMMLWERDIQFSA